MSDTITNEIKCPNCEYPMEMGQACPKCGLEDRSMVEKSIHDRDTEEITKVVLMCAADGCPWPSDDLMIVIRGQKQGVCTFCAKRHYTHLDQQQTSDIINTEGEMEEEIEGGE